jgi:hypothetical protein
MTQQHPITPPPELVQQWAREIYDKTSCGYERDEHIATRAAQWGADQELEACCEWVENECGNEGWGFHTLPAELRAARRPKPPSLKEQALADLDEIGSHYIGPGTADRIKTIRRALEQLDD